MKELSLNILDIAQNSVKADAKNIVIDLTEEGPLLTLRITDDGKGMKKDFLEKVFDPFTTTRTTRSVGLGLPLLKMASEATGGTMTIESKDAESYPSDHGTVVCATFRTDHIDCPPLGDIVSTVVLLIQSSPFEPNWTYTHKVDGRESCLDTYSLHEQLGSDIPLDAPEILAFVRDFLEEGEKMLYDE